MSNVPGDIRQSLDDETLLPLLSKLEDSYQGAPVQFVQTPNQQALANLIPALSAWARSATVQVQGGAIRFTFDGTTPTAVIGHRADVGAIITITGTEALRGFQWLSEAAVNNSLAITFWS